MVDVSVLDGRVPVRGLAASDFEILDNGVPQFISATTIDELPLDVTIVLDLNDPEYWAPGSSRSHWQPSQALADVKQVVGLLHARDRFRLLIAGADGVRQAFGLRAVSDGPINASTSPLSGSPLIASTLFDATAHALLPSSPSDRRSLVLIFTDGIDGASAISSEKLRRIAGMSDSVAYVARRLTVGEQRRLRNPKSDREGPELERLLVPVSPNVIDEVAALTGGASRQPRPDESLVSFFQGVVADFRQRYLFHYSPAGVADEGWHDIQVRLKKPSRYRIAARRGYFVESGERE